MILKLFAFVASLLIELQDYSDKRACVVQMSNDGTQFVVTSPDRRIRVFWFKTGKLRRVYDESLEVRNSICTMHGTDKYVLL